MDQDMDSLHPDGDRRHESPKALSSSIHIEISDDGIVRVRVPHLVWGSRVEAFRLLDHLRLILGGASCRHPLASSAHETRQRFSRHLIDSLNWESLA